jgi:hypothetical protein
MTTRARTSSLHAAIDIASGKVIGSLHARHRAIEFRSFLIKIDREVPAEFSVRVVLDNASTHKTPAIKRWPFAPSMARKAARFGSVLGVDRVPDVAEQRAEVAAEKGYRGDDDDRDQCDHQAVFDGGGALLAAVCCPIGQR